MSPSRPGPLGAARGAAPPDRSPAEADGFARGTLIATGFTDLDRVRGLLGARELAGLDREALVRVLADAPDPDQALLLFVRLLERAPAAAAVLQDADRALAMARLLGSSEALGEFLVRRPDHVDLLTDPGRAAATAPVLGPDGLDADPAPLRALLLEAVGADPALEEPVAGTRGKEAAAALRIAYRRQLTALALRDLTDPDPQGLQPRVSAWLSDLAGAAIEAALAVSRADAAEQFGDDAAHVSLAVIGMGKCGARELNYISDVDVVFAHSTDLADGHRAVTIATALAAGISRYVTAAAPEPGLWEVDANLRPEGKDGALSRTVDSHAEYYRRWAHTWEFQALLKARPLAGLPALGRDYIETIWPLVWTSSEREGFVASVQGMRRRVLDNIAHQDRDREIKLGAGGLRDVEFTVQLLQLVHGKTEESVRVRNTQDAVRALERASYISRKDAGSFAAAYRFLRLLEHRIQLVHLRRTHLMPERPRARWVLARAARGPGGPGPTDADGLTALWRRTRKDVRALHEKIFYRPLLSTTAALSADEVRLTPAAVAERLAALGYLDPAGAVRHIEALTAGVSRRASLQRQLLPVMLGWLANGPDPDGGLLAFRRLSESLGSSPWFLGMLRDSSAAAERLCQVLSSSRYISDLLEHLPEAAAWLGRDQELRPLSFAAQWQEIQAKMSRHPDADEAMRQIRLIRQREILRTAIADAAGLLDQDAVGHALSDADQAAVLGALRVAETMLAAPGGAADGPRTGALTDLLIVAMGRQGGREIGYGSDLDVMFVHRPRPGADPDAAQRQAVELARQVSALLTKPCRPPVIAERPLVVDADLRPEGKKGPLARSLESYQEYYRRWADVWEVQALLRARPVAGSEDLAAAFTAWADTVRYAGDPGPAALREIRRIKARVEAERLPRGADPARHLKLGRGGLSDVEWLVQTLQLRHAADHPALRTTGTMQALEALVREGLLPAGDGEVLHRAWQLASRIRSGIVVWSGKSSDVLPAKRQDLEAVARWCGYEPGGAAGLEEDYLRCTRHARQVFEKHFYGA
ncbi:bifunctional [glutamine synthetase] adenylyltransferase/[glutamine synthetase]-adenylyl-L-tyrosine phosphorylase [Citricoccus sp. SGAir0253]|uniref:bifunctional [glutamine synthetase] adenylyltransferase/[glutamine synthetase]-adenylyl-L-tyrosine phosphorylase n=1 Tax=Citricoccus sp. SGAir0253 TaxID=2567881 RepID=UPI0010CCF3DD|nr:bifunctional [glutamine synthetase] adenylyltransferase/[glutamine synthetase]-adenylyl-L-tyrosine phosphorylase [Citricoccus sp. SGAir0253]QCU79360.1 bifunctional [glutamine synthetase] adenylyltransferase/[glutamine synthetase]-adenylyl-L-tyrosine phosphorylase [Citricoccus sp. SGAir0253]